MIEPFHMTVMSPGSLALAAAQIKAGLKTKNQRSLFEFG
jgi:hypothetical protein